MGELLVRVIPGSIFCLRFCKRISLTWAKPHRDNTEDGTGAINYPSLAAVFLQWAGSKAVAAINAGFFFRQLPGRVQGAANGKSSLYIVLF